MSGERREARGRRGRGNEDAKDQQANPRSLNRGSRVQSWRKGERGSVPSDMMENARIRVVARANGSERARWNESSQAGGSGSRRTRSRVGQVEERVREGVSAAGKCTRARNGTHC